MLKSIPRLEPIDAEEAADHMAYPEDAAVSYPFSLGSKNKSDPASSSPPLISSEQTKKGTKRSIKREKNKYGEYNIPSKPKKLISNLSKIPSKWRKYFLKTGSASLTKGTWKKYYSAYKAFTKFCSEENIVNPWPISKSSIVCFILWCKKYSKIKASTTKSYLSALHTISKMLGLKSQKSSKEASKFLVRGLERSEKQDKKIPFDPLIFEILVALKSILDTKKWKKQSKKVVWASICLGYFGSFRAIELLATHQNSFDPSSNCTWNDIKIFSKNHMSVTIKNPKTKGGKSEKI